MLSKVLRNSSYLLVAQSLTKVIAFFYTFFLLANIGGVANYGLYIVALSYFALISSVSDFGLSQYTIREASVFKDRLPTLLSNVIALRLTILSVAFAVLAVILRSFDPDNLRVAVILLAALATFPQGIALAIDTAFVSHQRLQFSALGLLILSIFTTLLGISFLKLGWGVFGVLMALIFGQVIYSLYSLYILKKLKIRIYSKVKFEEIKKIIAGSFPYGVLIVLGLLYFKVDALILNYIKGSYDTGIYGAAYKFLEAVVFVPSAVSSALFPVLANLSHTAPQQIYKLYLKATGILFGLSLLVVAGYYLILPMIITRFLPQYMLSIQSIRILTLTIPFMFMISPQALVLLSSKKYLRPLIWISVFNLVLNVLLNLIFIPKYSFIGSSWVTLVSDVTSFSVFSIYIYLQFARRRAYG